jgi:hypothetical protein
MKVLKRIWKFLSWVEQEKVKATIHCGRPTTM